MVDIQTVCCMCGDIGFSEKLFRCTNCRYRFQHSYCSNYYSESADPVGICDWCQCENRSTSSRYGSSSKKSAPGSSDAGSMTRSDYSGGKIKQDCLPDRPKPSSGLPSPRPTTRRYKLLKDVMC